MLHALFVASVPFFTTRKIENTSYNNVLSTVG